MTFRVAISDSETELPRGFLGVEDQENPNNVKIALYASQQEAQKAIQAEIDKDEMAAREFVYAVVDHVGTEFDVTYYDGVFECWETFN